ncbi:unnamed protein product [Allacma fusca]|uniref:Uncharacterized protein n=1 Tax=Allacma fusca TaxID=39272 RepID=A0A8J2JVC4_9HEXA|nr:unnamed protein product [Allacma fusca]
MASSSLCPHLLQEYFKRVHEITEVYKSQLIKFVRYEDISGLLLNRRILKHEEHIAISQLLSNEIQMTSTLEILLRRMWGLENLITVLIEINVDSWLVGEMFQKYVHHVVNEVRRLQSLRSCRCFENERRSFIGKAAIRFFQVCDGWLFSVGTSLGCLTQTIYPTRNSLQFINNLLPIPRGSDEVVILPRIESIPFDYSYESDLGVQITEVYSDTEKSPTNRKSIEGPKLTNGILKKAIVNPTKSSEQNGSVSSPNSPRRISSRQPSIENEIKVRTSLAKTTRGQQKVVPRDLKLSSEKRNQKGMGKRRTMTTTLNLDEDESEEEPEVFQYRAEAMALVPVQMRASHYHMSNPRSQSADGTEFPENCFVFSPIPVLSNLDDSSGSSEPLKSGFQSTVAALPVHDNLLYSPYPFKHTFGEAEKRFGTMSSSSISQTNGSSQELSNILFANFESPNYTNSIQRSMSIPAFRKHSFDVSTPYFTTTSIPEESGEISKPVITNSSKQKVPREGGTNDIPSLPISLQETQVKTTAATRKNQDPSLGLGRTTSRSSSFSKTPEKEIPKALPVLEKSKSSTLSKPSRKSGVNLVTKKTGYTATSGRSMSIRGTSMNARASLKNKTTRTNSTVGKPEIRSLSTERTHKNVDADDEIYPLSNQNSDDEEIEVPSDPYATVVFPADDISIGQPDADSAFTEPMLSQGMEDKMQPEGYPSNLNNAPDEKSFIAYDKATWLPQEFDRILDTSTSGSGSRGSDDSILESNYSSRSASLSPVFLNTKINWDEKLYADASPEQDSNSNLILRGVLEDDPILENSEIFSEDSVSNSTANLGASNNDIIVSLPVDKQPDSDKELTPVADETKSFSSEAKAVRAQTPLLSKKVPDTNASVPRVSSAARTSPNVGKSTLKDRTNSPRSEVKQVNSPKPSPSSPSKLSTAAKTVLPKAEAKVVPPKSSVRRNLFPVTPTSPKAQKASVGRKPIGDPKAHAKSPTTTKKNDEANLKSPVKIDRNSLEPLLPLPTDVVTPTKKSPNEKCSTPVGKVKSTSDLGSIKVLQGIQQSKAVRRAFSDSDLRLVKNSTVFKIKNALLAGPSERSCSSNSLNRQSPDVNFHPVTVESGSKLESKSLADASSQTAVLKKNATSAGTSPSIAKPVASPTNVMRTNGTPRRSVSMSPKPVAAKGRTTPTGSVSPVSESSTSSKHSTVTPTKPAWNNKKPTPTPLVPPERFSPFSIEDYNFQQWANEWASRQEKKKQEPT